MATTTQARRNGRGSGPTAVPAPPGGRRYGGRIYQEAEPVPSHLLRTGDRVRDPASYQGTDIPPNFGRSTIPHVITFRGILTSLSKAYRASDEALRHSAANANMMRLDPAIMGPLHARQMMTSLLKWSVIPEDEDDARQKAAAENMQSLIDRIPRFTEYRRNLLEATWYGRYANVHQWGLKRDSKGRRSWQIRKWTPLHGDKIVFRYDDGSGEFDAEQIGVKIAGGLDRGDAIAGERRWEPTSDGLAYFFKPWEQDRLAIHKHMIMDAPFDDPMSGGMIHGVGIRHFLYWTWYQKQETLAQLVEVVERTGMGFVVYYYPSGNAEARDEVERISQEQAHTNVILMPFDPDEPDAYRVDQIPPNTAGIDALAGILDDYYGDMITRFILGQTLSTKASATGLGSGVADLQQDSLGHIVRYDAVNLEETLTDYVLRPYIQFNAREWLHHNFRVRISTEATQPKDKLDALNQVWQMGAKLRTADLMDAVGATIPRDQDDVVYNPQVVQAIEHPEQAGDLMGGAPGQPGAGVDDGTGMPAPESEEAPVPGLMEQIAADAGDDGAALIDDGGAQQNEQPEETPSQERKRIFGPILNKKPGEAGEYAKDAPGQQMLWNEDDHPRDDDGKFGSGPGSSEPTEVHASKIPDSWTGDIELFDHTGVVHTDSADAVRQAVADSPPEHLEGLNARQSTDETKAAAKASYVAKMKAIDDDRAAKETHRLEQEKLRTPSGVRPGHDDYKPTPEKLYHATYNADDIHREGFKSGAELGKQTLGGSASNLVSFTTKENAETYRDGLELARRASRGEVTDEEMLKQSERFGVSQSWMRKIIDQENAKGQNESRTSFAKLQQMSFAGKKFPLFMASDWADHIKDAGPAGMVEIDPSQVEDIRYSPTETEWRIGDTENIAITPQDDAVYFKGDRARKTGNVHPEYGEELELMEGPNKGQMRHRQTSEQRTTAAQQKQQEWTDQQAGFKRLADNPDNDQSGKKRYPLTGDQEAGLSKEEHEAHATRHDQEVNRLGGMLDRITKMSADEARKHFSSKAAGLRRITQEIERTERARDIQREFASKAKQKNARDERQDELKRFNENPPIQYHKDKINTAAGRTATDPSPAQREAGNYPKGSFGYRGLKITIENARGSTRSASDGSWTSKIKGGHYGYINRTEGADGDHVDVWLGPEPESELVVVIDQETKGGRFDEHKVVLGCKSAAEAKALYLANYPAGWRCGPITTLTFTQFRAWLAAGDTKRRLAPQTSKYAKGPLVVRYAKDWEEGDHPRDEAGRFAAVKAMATGTELAGFKKIHDEASDMPWWVNEETSEALDDQRLAARLSDDDLATATRNADEQPETSGHSRTALAGMFGLRKADIGDDRRTDQRLTLAAKQMGYRPEGENEKERADDAAHFLASQADALTGTVDIAKAYGWQERAVGASNNLVTRARSAANHLVKTAIKAGYEMEDGADDEERLGGAMEYLAGQVEPEEPNSTYDDAMDALSEIGDAIGPWGKSILSFWAAMAVSYWATKKIIS